MKARTLLALILLTGLTAWTMPQAKKPLEVKDLSEIKKNSPYINEVVTFKGLVTQLEKDRSHTTILYYVQDQWGKLIQVRTTGEPPVYNYKYTIVGLALLTPDGTAYVLEQKREPLIETASATAPPPTAVEPASGAVPPEVTTGPVSTGQTGDTTLPPLPDTTTSEPAGEPGGLTPPPEPGLTATEPGTEPALNPSDPDIAGPEPSGFSKWMSNPVVMILVALAVVIVIVLAVLMVLMAKSRKGESATLSSGTGLSGDFPASTQPEPPGEVVETKTIKISVPPPKTLKLLPGRLEIVGGDDQLREIRFYRVGGSGNSEVTFGRAKGPEYTHVQLKSQTVSSKQAKLMFSGAGQAALINFASPESNPTQINGREMGLEERVTLNQGDQIAMGELKFRFHAS